MSRASLGASFILCYLSVPQVNVVTEAAIKDSCHSSWIFEACLYSNPFVLLSPAAKLPSLPHGKSLLIPLSNHRLWTASVWTRSRPTLATPITPVAPGDQTGMGMFPVCRQPFHLTVCFSAVSVRHSHDRNLFLPDHILYPTPWLFCVFLLFFYWNAFSEHFVALFVFRLSGPHVGCEIMRQETAEREQARDWDGQSLWIRVVTAERF